MPNWSPMGRARNDPIRSLRFERPPGSWAHHPAAPRLDWTLAPSPTRWQRDAGSIYSVLCPSPEPAHNCPTSLAREVVLLIGTVRGNPCVSRPRPGAVSSRYAALPDPPGPVGSRLLSLNKCLVQTSSSLHLFSETKSENE